MHLTLISRRSRFRDGTRYNTRGVDKNGNVANYVETEQVVYLNESKLSFLQTRGSIPLLWGQTGRKYTPTTKINSDFNLSQQYFSKHLSEQIMTYGPQLVVNLLDQQRGPEQKLSKAFEEHIRSFDHPAVNYVAFNFNEKCKGGNYENLSELTTQLIPLLDCVGLCRVESNGNLKSLQSGVVRVNCLDCLDRTNLVQSSIGKVMMREIIEKERMECTTLDRDMLDRILNEAWANNGDAISMQYAGTSALKGDFTRTGKRQTRGVVQDSFNSISRYYINQFKDAARQIGVDILNGTYQPNDAVTISEEQQLLEDQENLTKLQRQSIEYCINWIEEQGFIEDEELVTFATIIISTNYLDIPQERILVLTNKAFYRIKYIFNSSTEPVSRCTRIEHSDVILVKVGPMANKPNQYGFSFEYASPSNQNQSKHIYSGINYSKDTAIGMVGLIKELIKDWVNPSISVVEGPLVIANKGLRSIVAKKLKF